MRKRKIVFGIIVIALTALIVFTSTNTGEEHSRAGGVIIGWINDVFFGGGLSSYEKEAIVGVGAKFLGHFSLFLLDGLFFWLFLKEFGLSEKKMAILFVAYGFLLSCAGEVIQIFSEGRYPTFNDVLIDFSGFTFTYAVRFLLKHPI
ncbi:MAG: VanZ family protein [Bacilli bacterium]|nr:VanZ family protein [Bacilli bacterium]